MRKQRVSLPLSRLMSNIGGPRQQIRKLLACTTMPMLMYAEPVWGSLVRFKSHIKGYESTQRLASIKQISAHRTVSNCAANVLAGNIPISMIIKRAAEVRKAFAEAWHADQVKAIHDKSMDEWHVLWNNTTKGCWTFELIPELNECIE